MTNATSAVLSDDGQTLTVFVPLNFRKRGGRKLIIPPAGAPEPVYSPPQPKVNPPLVKALARAHRWKKLIDTKQYATIKQIAEAEKVHESYCPASSNLRGGFVHGPSPVQYMVWSRIHKPQHEAYIRWCRPD